MEYINYILGFVFCSIAGFVAASISTPKWAGLVCVILAYIGGILVGL